MQDNNGNQVIRHADRASTSGKIAPNSEEVFFRGHEHLSDVRYVRFGNYLVK